MPPGDSTQTKTIKVEMVAKGAPELKELVNGLDGLDKKVGSMAGTLGTFRNLFAISFAGVGIRELASMADSFTNLESRLNSFGGNAKDTPAIIDAIYASANTARVSVEDFGSTFTRLSVAMKEAHLSSNALMAITQTLSNSFRLSGSNSQEAANASVQFAQAMSLGVLRGQDLKSVLSQNASFSLILGNYLHKTKGELQLFAEAGNLTSSTVLKALALGMNDINDRAAKMSQTFEQSVQIAMNNFKKKVGELAKDLGAGDKFATAMDYVTNHMESLGIAIGILAVTKIPAMISALGTASTALLALAASNPFLLAFTVLIGGISAAVVYFGVTLKDIKNGWGTFVSALKIGGQELQIVFLNIMGAIFKTFGMDGLAGVYSNLSALEDKNLSVMKEKARDRILLLEQEHRVRTTLNKLKLEDAKNEINGMKDKEILETREQMLIRLNKAFEEGTMTIASYYDELERVDQRAQRTKFLQGKEDLEKMNEALQKFKLAEFNRELNAGTRSLESYNQAVEDNSVGKLNIQLQAGRISLIQYDAELVKISSKFETGSVMRSGAEAYIKSVGTLSQGISGLVTSTFTHLEDVFVQFTKTGKANFSDFAHAVLDELNLIIIRSMIIRPLAQGILNFAMPSAPASSMGGAGGGYASPTMFASGGIVDSPTLFSHGSGKMGMAGESGPEAILPLTRGPGGDLGVKSAPANVNINIVNNAGVDISQKETTSSGGGKMIDVIITAKVKEGISSGAFDKSFQQSFGINRKGS